MLFRHVSRYFGSGIMSGGDIPGDIQGCQRGMTTHQVPVNPRRGVQERGALPDVGNGAHQLSLPFAEYPFHGRPR